ncbi:MAG: hypothetical protein ACR2PZ_11795 [Pseudomonadales bacterium]
MTQESVSTCEVPSNVIETITAQCVSQEAIEDSAHSKAESTGGAATAKPIESDLTAIANVRELLLGDVIRSIREEVLCNHSIILNRFEALHASTSKRMDIIVKKLVHLKRELDVESNNRTKQLKALKRHFDKQDQSIRLELQALEEQLSGAAKAARVDLEDKIIEQARNLIKTESRMNDQLNADVSKLGTEKLKRSELADSLRTIADQVNQGSSKRTSRLASAQ